MWVSGFHHKESQLNSRVVSMCSSEPRKLSRLIENQTAMSKKNTFQQPLHLSWSPPGFPQGPPPLRVGLPLPLPQCFQLHLLLAGQSSLGAREILYICYFSINKQSTISPTILTLAMTLYLSYILY